MTKSNLAVIPCEYCGNEGQFSPVSIVSSNYFYFQRSLAFVVNLRELRLAPEAFEPKQTNENESVHSFIPRENIEVWLTHNKKSNCDKGNQDITNVPIGSWWPGRIISIHDKFVHCEVIAPKCHEAVVKHLSDLQSTQNLSLQAIVVEISDIRRPWNGKKFETSLLCGSEKSLLEARPFVSLEDEDVLFHYKMILPDYLSHIFSSLDVNTNLLKFCGAPCLLTFENQSHDGSNKMKLGIVSGSAEAIRRASLLEIVHSSLLHERLKVSETNASNGYSKGFMSKKNSIANSVNGDGNPSELGLRNFDDVSSRVSCVSPNGISDCRISPNDDDSSNILNSESSLNNVRPMHFTKLNSKVTGKPIYEGTFKINPNLVGIIIGHQGSNISKARQISGVQEISVSEDIVTVLADSVEACENVREILDIIEVEIPIFSEFTPRIVGTGGENLKRLVEQSGVRKAFIHGPEARAAMHKNDNFVEKYELGVSISKSRPTIRQLNSHGEEKSLSEEALSAVFIIGTRPSINKMRILLEYQFDNWNELSELEGTKRSLQNELRKIDNRPNLGITNVTRKKFYLTNNTNSVHVQNEDNSHNHNKNQVSFNEEDFPPPNQQNRPQNVKNRKSIRTTTTTATSNNNSNNAHKTAAKSQANGIVNTNNKPNQKLTHVDDYPQPQQQPSSSRSGNKKFINRQNTFKNKSNPANGGNNDSQVANSVSDEVK